MSLPSATRPGGNVDALHPSRIAGSRRDVLPAVPLDVLIDALRRLPRDEFDIALRQKYFPIATMPGLRLYAACGEAAAERARAAGRKVVALTAPEEFHAALRESHGSQLLNEATYWLATRRPEQSASYRMTGKQIVTAATLGALLIAGFVTLPAKVIWVTISTLAALFFLSIIALRVLCLMRPGPLTVPRDDTLQDDSLPVYSVLVPVFRETAVLHQLLQALGRLDYPRDKLDIKLILEENDTPMREAVASLALPDHFEVIVVPAGKPQTKPRALNYALAFARGELLTIYDAEDIPEPMQLRQAAASFAACELGVACLQAELVFYNANENWLARQFTIEYATLFGLLLPKLASHGLPLLLGGTSNHFRIDALRAVGAWDPFNVTEDADLGLRLARAGYESGAIDSRTYEEANVALGNWLHQRARWLKGFLLTWFVHNRDPAALRRDLEWSGFWVAQATTLGVFGSALLHPLCLILTITLWLIEPPLAPDAPLVLHMLAGLNLMVFVTGYGATMMAGARGLRHIGITGWGLRIASMPVYWLLMSLAAWIALWQFVVAPFHWNKTRHGLSGVQRQTAGRAVRIKRKTQSSGA